MIDRYERSKSVWKFFHPFGYPGISTKFYSKLYFNEKKIGFIWHTSTNDPSFSKLTKNKLPEGWLVPDWVSSIVLVRALTPYILLHSMCDLKVTWTCSVVSFGNFMLYEFELDNNIVEVISPPPPQKKGAKWEGAVDHCTETR